ncbi:rod shape-determining protein RodA [Desulforegula conservatrix]|uniref:rod shape-determining protein RodA n=1 Tax=Desulforegula conservatrix TaxID=153026 RepID=UPI0004804E26|nr:rod shape-determining protein RodA [Desulforegula conservatrix]
MIGKREIDNFSWGLIAVIFLLGIVSTSTIYSALAGDPSGAGAGFALKQAIWYCAGFVAMLFISLFNYRILEKWGYAVFMACLLMLVAVLLFGKLVAGSRRWLDLGVFALQPSEFAKIGAIIVLAKYYSISMTVQGYNMRDLFAPVLLMLCPFVLILVQPDLGTALLIGFISISITLFVKVEKKTLIISVLCGIVVVISAWFFLLKEYQKQRIMTFLNPEHDPLGSGYHVIQSKIAIGSGMLFGKGYLKGTQSHLSFLPEQHTDFIFSVFTEEWGFVGAVTLLVLYMILIAIGLNIANNSRDHFGTVLCIGVLSMIFWQVFINVGMIMGLLPVVGVPLPLISYGGSSVLTTLIGCGIILNVGMRRFSNS